jgi:hypothetical protein
MKRFGILLLVIVRGSSLVFCQAGPAGVGLSANLTFWLDANSGNFNSPVDVWQDVSGNNVSTTVNGNPVFVSNVLNGQSIVRFDGNGDEVYTNLSINATDYDQLSVIAVYIPRVDHAGAVWGEDNGAWDRFLIDSGIIDLLNSAVGAGYDPEVTTHPSTNIPTLFVTNTATLSTVVYDDDLENGTHVYIGGQLARSFTSNAADYYYPYPGNGYSNFYVGAIGEGAAGFNGFRFTGDIAEVIVFRNDISLTQRILVENYLAAKYGLSLPGSVDLYNEDDFGYDFNVAGIGSLNGSTQTDSRGTGIVRMWSPSDLNNTEFLFWGDDNGMLQATNVTDIPTGVQARSNRIWRVSEVNTSLSAIDVGSVNISFLISNLGPVDPDHLRLLVDTDNDGLFADETPITGAVSLGSSEYAFNAVTSLANNLRFTIGTSNTAQTPLPVELAYFSAEAIHGMVNLSWQTYFEKEVSTFQISRSGTGHNWTELGQVQAAGAGTYSFVDKSPLSGRNYYRLSSRDFNSDTETMSIATVYAHGAKTAVAYPNPFKNMVTIQSDGKDLSTISISNEQGVDCTAKTKFVIRDDKQTELNLSELSDGPYVINIKGYPSIHVFKITN